jgi:hypothetical protein
LERRQVETAFLECFAVMRVLGEDILVLRHA